MRVRKSGPMLNEGLFAQPSNIGLFHQDHFSVIPQIRLKFGYDIFRNVNAFMGYDFIYWMNTVRAGSQIDRNINFTQSQVFGTGTLVGPATPSPAFHQTDFWAQGINFGLTWRY